MQKVAAAAAVVVVAVILFEVIEWIVTHTTSEHTFKGNMNIERSSDSHFDPGN